MPRCSCGSQFEANARVFVVLCCSVALPPNPALYYHVGWAFEICGQVQFGRPTGRVEPKFINIGVDTKGGVSATNCPVIGAGFPYSDLGNHPLIAVTDALALLVRTGSLASSDATDATSAGCFLKAAAKCGGTATTGSQGCANAFRCNYASSKMCRFCTGAGNYDGSATCSMVFTEFGSTALCTQKSPLKHDAYTCDYP
jgi:hypothetical protein